MKIARKCAIFWLVFFLGFSYIGANGGEMLISTLLAFGVFGGLTFDIPSIDGYRYVSIREVEAQDALKRSTSESALSSEINDYHVVEVKVKLTANSSYTTPSTYLSQTVDHETLFLIVKSPGFAPSTLSSPVADVWPWGSGHCIKGTISSGATFTVYAEFTGGTATSPSSSTGVSWGLVLRRYKADGSTIGDISVKRDSAITKYLCNDATVDSRRYFGQPNTDGDTSTVEANAPFRAINFGDSRFKGGLYVGNTSGSPDRSRTSRIQFWPQGVGSTSSVKAGCISALALNQPEGFTGALNVGSFVPTASTNLSETEMTATWDKAFDVTPQTLPGSPDLSLCNKYPLDSFSIPTGDQGHIFSWNLTFPPSVSATVPSQIGSAVCLANKTEESLPTNVWRYFASREYVDALPAVSPYTSFPWTDAKARLFLLTDAP